MSRVRRALAAASLALVLAAAAAAPARAQGGAPGTGGDAQGQYEAGLKRYEAGDYPGAIPFAEAGLRIDPEHGRCYYLRGAARLALGDAAAALPDLQSAIRNGAGFAAAYSERGRAYLNLHDLVQAESDFWVASIVDPKFWPAPHNLGAVAIERKDYAAAREWYTRAIALNPQGAGAYLWRGKASREMRDHAAALNDFTTYIRLVPQAAEGYQERAATHEAMRNFAARDADLAEARKRSGGGTPAPTQTQRLARIHDVRLVFNVRNRFNPQSPMGVEFDIDLEIAGSRGMDCELGVAFYGPDGKPVRARTQQYSSRTGELCSYIKFIPDNDPRRYPNAYIWIPFEEFQFPRGEYSIGYQAYVFCYPRQQYLAEPKTGNFTLTVR